MEEPNNKDDRFPYILIDTSNLYFMNTRNETDILAIGSCPQVAGPLLGN